MKYEVLIIKTLKEWNETTRESIRMCFVDCIDGDDVRRKAVSLILNKGLCTVIVGSKKVFDIAWINGDIPDISARSIAISAVRKYFAGKEDK